MAGIQMCTGAKMISENHVGACPKRDQCYRYTAPPTPGWQSYGWPAFQEYEGQTVCRDFWPKDER